MDERRSPSWKRSLPTQAAQGARQASGRTQTLAPRARLRRPNATRCGSLPNATANASPLPRRRSPPLVEAGQLGPGEDVALELAFHLLPRGAFAQPRVVHVQGVEVKNVTVRAVARGRAWAVVADF